CARTLGIYLFYFDYW
nr:immunoglobulin heavy chain junction region [Macaca mulatta]MOW27041.1 immunoglobulin heavy chain junction region [Macaca mulatta]